jgi:hypothetical protein
MPRLTSALALLVAGCATAGPAHERLPLESDIQRCALRASDLGSGDLMGKLRLHLLVRADGHVFASYVHNETGVDNRKLEGCIAYATTNWVLPEVDVGYERAYEISFAPGGPALPSGSDYNTGQGWSGSAPPQVFLPSMLDSPSPLPLEEKAARETLTLAEFASLGERATALVTVGLAAEATPVVRQALLDNPSDADALLALVRVLAAGAWTEAAEREAREAAFRLRGLDPGGVLGEEALLRACLAAGDDRCAVEQWPKLLRARGAKTRSRILAELEQPTRTAASRLQRARDARQQ